MACEDRLATEGGCRMVRTTAVIAVLLALALPASASADSGSITNVQRLADGQMQATFSTSSTTCTDIGFCGWFPTATQVPVEAPCAYDANGLVYVGEYQDASGTQTATDTFYP